MSSFTMKGVRGKSSRITIINVFSPNMIIRCVTESSFQMHLAQVSQFFHCIIFTESELSQISERSSFMYLLTI